MNGGKTNLNIYYSAMCNMNCNYCCAGESNPDENAAIRAAIQNGSFQNYVITRCQEQEPITLGIWGREPTINQDLWKDFIIPILTECESIKGIFLSTNGLEFDYHAWANCLLDFCNAHERKIKFWIQWSIDGPNCDQVIIDNLYESISAYETNDYFRVKYSTKSTLQAKDLRTNIELWNNWMANLHTVCQSMAMTGCDVSNIGIPPTIERPGNYTQEDGIYWFQWEPDKMWPFPNQISMGCAAGVTSWTIDYQGNIWDCPLKKNKTQNVPFTFEEFFEHIKKLLDNYEIVYYRNWYRIYRIILSEWCWATSTIDDLDSYLRVWCNEAITKGE